MFRPIPATIRYSSESMAVVLYAETCSNYHHLLNIFRI